MRAQAAGLETGWAARNKAMTALVGYANSLVAITESGERGGESARKLADAAGTLVETLKATNPLAGRAGSLVVDTFEYAYAQIARARAAKSLEEALALLQPAIDRIAILLALDLEGLDELIATAIDSQRDEIDFASRPELNYRKQLISTRRDLMVSAQRELGEGIAPSKLADTSEIERVAELLAQAESWHAAYLESRAKVAARGRLSRELISATKQAVADWSTAHAGLLAAVREKRLPTVTELVQANAHIRGLVDRYREL